MTRVLVALQICYNFGVVARRGRYSLYLLRHLQSLSTDFLLTFMHYNVLNNYIMCLYSEKVLSFSFLVGIFHL